MGIITTGSITAIIVGTSTAPFPTATEGRTSTMGTDEVPVVFRPRRALDAILLGVALAVSHVALALAHSELRRSVPPDGAVVAHPPERLDLYFSERVRLTALRLFRTEGGELGLPDRRAIREADHESLRLPPLPAGDYRAEWRAISGDGHTVGGIIRFRVLQAREDGR